MRRLARKVLLVTRVLIVVTVAVQIQVVLTIQLVRQVRIRRASRAIQVSQVNRVNRVNQSQLLVPVKAVIQKARHNQVRPVILMTRINRHQIVQVILSRQVRLIVAKKWILARARVNRQHQEKLTRIKLHQHQLPRLIAQLSRLPQVLHRHGNRRLRRQVRQLRVLTQLVWQRQAVLSNNRRLRSNIQS